MAITFDDLPDAQPGGGGGAPISFDDLPDAKSALQSFADAGGAAITKRGIGLMQLGADALRPFGISSPAFDKAAQAAVANQDAQAQGTGGIGTVTGLIADPVNLAPLPGGLALKAGQGFIKGVGKLAGAGAYYGGLAGATGGEQDDTGLAGRAGEAVKDASIGAVAVPLVGKTLSGAARLIAKPLGAAFPASGPSAAEAAEGSLAPDAVTAPAAPADPVYTKVAQRLLRQPGATPDSVMRAAGDAQTGAVPLTLPEATGNDSLLKQQRVLGELSTQAGTDYNAFNNQRLQTAIPYAKQAVVEAASAGAPAATLTDAGSQINTAAKGIIDDAIEARKAATAPEYKAMKGDIVPDDTIYALRSNPAIEQEYQKVLGNDALMERTYAFKPRVPPEIAALPPEIQQQALAQLGPQPLVKTTQGGLDPNSLGVWHNVKQNLDAQYQRNLNQYGKATPEGRLFSIGAKNVNSALEGVNAKYATTNADFAAQSGEIQNLWKSPLGALARSQSPEGAAKAFMNMSREQLQGIMPALMQKDPGAVKSMASAMMREVTDKTDGSGIKTYINALSKNTLVKDKMQAILSPEAYQAQQELVDTLEKVLSGQTRNSETASKIETLKDINDPNMIDAAVGAVSAGASRDAWIKRGLQVLKDTSYKLNAQKHAALMDAFISPDLEKLGAALKNVSAKQKENIALQYLGSKTGAAALTDMESQERSQPKPRPQLQAPTIEHEPQAGISGILNNASHVSGISPILLQRISQAESSDNPNASNKNSSARGLFQFTTGTWNAMVDKYGAQTGITKKDIFNPQANATMGALYARENADKLGQFLGRSPTAGEVYMAHYFGLDGAKKLLSSLNGNQSAASILPEAAHANRRIFYNGLTPRTPLEVYRLLNNKINGV